MSLLKFFAIVSTGIINFIKKKSKTEHDISASFLFNGHTVILKKLSIYLASKSDKNRITTSIIIMYKIFTVL